MSAQLTESAAYTSLAGALDKFLNLAPLVNSIEGVLNDYRPAAYAIAFMLLVVGTMREFLYPETRRFLQGVLQAVLLVATISFAANLVDWCDQAAQALAQLPAAQQVSFGNGSYSMKPGETPTVTQLEQVLQAKS
jgi:outer membrane protein OmpA-like peptidoglycan-associated protein